MVRRARRSGGGGSGSADAAAALEMDRTVMQVAEQRGAADGDDDRVRQPLGEQAIERLGVGLFQRRDRLVEQEDVRLRQQRAHEGGALLLAAGKHRRPVGFLVEPVDEMRQPDIAQRSRIASSSACSASVG